MYVYYWCESWLRAAHNVLFLNLMMSQGYAGLHVCTL